MQLKIPNSKELPINCLRNRLWIVLRVHGMQRLFEAWRNDAAWTRRSGRNHMGFTSGYKKGQQEVTNKFGNGYFHLREKCIGTILAGFKTSELVVPDSVRLTLSTTHKRFFKQLIGSSFEFWISSCIPSPLFYADWLHWFKSHCI